MNPSALVADVGRVNTRIALAHAAPERPQLAELLVVPTPRDDLRRIFGAYLRATGIRPPPVCAVAIAGRVQRDGARTWGVVTQASTCCDCEQLAEISGARNVLLVNDLAAVAAALPLLTPAEVIPLGPPGRKIPGVQLVVGVGAGFGAAALTADGAVLETECGHADLAAVGAEERLWLERLAARGRVSVESVLSGPGLPRLYEAMSGAPLRTGEAVLARARAGEAVAARCLSAFSQWLGRVVGDLVLLYGAWSGVYLTGGALPGLGRGFDIAAFRTGMQDKPPFETELAGVPVHYVLQAQPALLGLARLALQNGKPSSLGNDGAIAPPSRAPPNQADTPSLRNDRRPRGPV